MREFIGGVSLGQACPTTLEYYIVNRPAYQYGIEILKKRGQETDRTCVYRVTTNYNEARLLTARLMEGTVFPSTLIDVIDDYLCDQCSPFSEV